MDRQYIETLKNNLLEIGALKVGVVNVNDIVFDREFRKLCESNACGKYGKSWTCPPDAGDIDDLIAYAKSFDEAIIYQTVGELEDSYDFEGMMAAGHAHNLLTQKFQQTTKKENIENCLHLGAGGCRVCETCTKPENKPCRHPEIAIKSLETFGIDVSQLSKLAGMNYINGQNTVTFFGGFFYNIT